jgi:hypothetical protein
MIKKLLVGTFVLVAVSNGWGQDQDSSRWNFNAYGLLYLIPDDVFVLPIFIANQGKLHLEGRYNYEERETVSAWVGYNISGGNDFEYLITPMFGGIAGVANGVAPGLEVTLGYKRFEFYTEAEYMFDFEAENYFYAWSSFTYYPTDWLWTGIAGQRTRLYQSDLEVQKGLLVGAGLKNWKFISYVYDIANDPFVVLSLSVSF